VKKRFLPFLILFALSSYAQNKKQDTLPIPKCKISGRINFIFNQSSFSNWTSGGQNIVAGNLNVNYDLNYTEKNANWDTRIITGYGFSYSSDKGYRKTNDRFELNTLLEIETTAYWFFSFLGNFRTLYTKGFNYKKVPIPLVSEFLTPAYLTFGPGMLFKKSNNLSTNITPATARYTFVNDFSSEKFGVKEGKNTSINLGINLSGYYKFSIIKNIETKNILTIYSDYLANFSNVALDYQANIRFKMNNHFKMNMSFHTIIDDDSTRKIPFRELFGLGVNYNFYEKVTS
jgi:hypothetical protein